MNRELIRLKADADFHFFYSNLSILPVGRPRRRAYDVA